MPNPTDLKIKALEMAIKLSEQYSSPNSHTEIIKHAKEFETYLIS